MLHLNLHLITSNYICTMSQFYWKASFIDHLTDARFFNTLENAWMEFSFDALEERAITLEKAKAIKDWLYEPQIVASFGLHQSPEEIHFILSESKIEHAAISIQHELVQDEDFLDIAFLKMDISQLDAVGELANTPFALIISTNETLSDFEIEKIKNLEKNSLVFLHLPYNFDNIKSQFIQFDKIGIEIPTQPEESPGISALEIYDQFIEAIES
jgi:hypothetical protein